MRKIFRLFEQGFIVLSLVFCTGGVLAVILGGGISEGQEGAEPDFALSRSVFTGLSAIALCLLLPHWKRALYLLTREKWIVVLVACALTSTLWSEFSDITLRRSLGLVATTILGTYFATRYTLKQQLQLLAWAFGVAVGLSFVFALVLPLYGVEHGVHAGAWRGIYFTKNVLGKIMVLSATVFWLLATNSDKRQFLFWLGFFLSIVLIMQSASASALLNVLILIAACFAFKTLRWQPEVMIPVVLFLSVGVGLLGVWFFSNAETFLGLLGKGTNLTGRPELWAAVSRMIGQHLFLGYGYSGFWLDYNNDAILVHREIRWPAPNSHNGFLDLGLELGLLGVTIFSLGFWSTLTKSLKWTRQNRTVQGLWPAVFITYSILSNLTESSLLGQNSIFWVLYIGINLSMFKSAERSPPMVEESSSRALAQN